MGRGQKALEEEIAKLTNRSSVQAAEIERLTEINKSIKNDLDSRYSESNEEAKRLKKRILELEREINMAREQNSKDNEAQSINSYKLEKMSSCLHEIDALAEEIPADRKVEQVIKRLRESAS